MQKEPGISEAAGKPDSQAGDPNLPTDSELLRTLLDNVPDMIYFKDLQSRFLRISKGLMVRIGVKDHKEIAGKSDFDFYSPEHARQAFDDEKNVINSGRPIIGIEEKETYPDRPDRWVSTTKMPFRNAKGDIIGTFGISRDITEIKRYRDDLQKAKDELEERVRERTSELSEAKLRLEQNLEQLEFLNVTAYNLVQIVEIDELFKAIGKAFMARFSSAQATICRRTKQGFSCVFAKGVLDSHEGRAFSEAALQPFLQKELVNHLVISDWRQVFQGNPAWSEAIRENSCWIALPLTVENKTFAIIQLVVPPSGEAVFRREQTLLSTLASHAATCISNALYYQELEVKARLEGELEAARNIQQSLTPSDVPSIPHVALCGIYLPAYEVGGDYLDYFQCGEGSWVVIVADVCGKGIPAAMLMTILRSVARVEARSNCTAKSLLCAVNQSICCNINERSFITALCLVIRQDGSAMTYARAGHVKLLRIDGATHTVAPVESGGIALGIIADAREFSQSLDEVALQLTNGDGYLAMTDGVSEANNPAHEFFGIPRVISALERHKTGTAEEIVNGVLDEVHAFSGSEPAHDDVTMFAMKVVCPDA